MLGVACVHGVYVWCYLQRAALPEKTLLDQAARSWLGKSKNGIEPFHGPRDQENSKNHGYEYLRVQNRFWAREPQQGFLYLVARPGKLLTC